jgi:glycosyltransferase domain-containing protein
MVYLPLPGLNDTQAISELLNVAKEPYAAVCGDDDFLVPASLEKCVQFLKGHQDYSAAHGVGAYCPVDIEASRGERVWSFRYGLRSVEQESGTNRLLHYIANYFPVVFSVRRTEMMREGFSIARSLPDRHFRELLPASLAVVGGKAMQLDCFYLVRGIHQRQHALDQFDWVTGPDWQRSYEGFREPLSKALARQDTITLDEARQVVKEAFSGYLARKMLEHMRTGYGRAVTPRRSRFIKIGRSVPLLRGTWRQLRSIFLKAEERKYSLGALLRPSSPYHADFLPIYRAITAAGDKLDRGGS